MVFKKLIGSSVAKVIPKILANLSEFLVNCNMRDSDPFGGKVWNYVGFSFSYVISS